jgi:putative ABC transport system permease protein
MMGTLLADLRYAIRSLRRQPTLATVAILTLVLGIGANVAMFTVVKRVLFDPLPYPDSDRLVVLWEVKPAGETDLVSTPTYHDWRRLSTQIEEVAAYRHVRYTFTGADGPINVPALRATPGLFTVLQAQAAIGRTFVEEEGTFGREHVVILGRDFWQRHFGGDRSIVGRAIVLDSEPYTVVGVMPAGFLFPPGGDEQIWTALSFDPKDRHGQSRRARALNVVGRLRAGASLEQAQRELSVIARQLGTEYADSNAGWDARIVPAQEQLVRRIRPALLVVFGAVGFLLLIVCANVANLMLARLTSRRREIAVRSALGAGRLQLVRQVMTESLILALAGGALGLVTALATLRLMRVLPAAVFPRFAEVGIDAGVLAFTLGLSLGVAAVFGLLPAFQVTRANIRDMISESSAGIGSPTSIRLLNGLVVLEVAVALVLLVGAGLMTRSFAELMKVDPGFDPDRVVAAQIHLPPTKYRTAGDRIRFFSQLVDRTKALPGVVSAGAVTSLPMHPVGIDFALTFSIEGQAAARRVTGEDPQADIRSVMPGYFETMKIPLVRGRLFDERDRQGMPSVMVINETLLRRYFAGEDPIDRTVRTPHGAARVIGIVADTHHHGLDSEPRPEIFLPFLQNAFMGMAVVARTAADPAELAALIRREVLAVDPEQPIFDLRTMEAVLSRSVFLPRLSMLLLAAFAGSALLMAVVGIYGVMSYAVSQRTRELGLRMALGARTQDTMRLVVGQSMALVAIGILIGVAGAIGVTRTLSGLLYGVSPLDPLVFGAVAAALAGTALTACLMPARRATKVDPIQALREL